MSKKLIFSIFFVVSLFNFVCYGYEETATNNGNSWEKMAAHNVKKTIKLFLQANTEKRFGMMTKHFQDVTKTSLSVRNSFDKESYEIDKFIQVEPFVYKKTKERFVYIKLDLSWFFEGYNGKQTCHFQLKKVGLDWKIDWFIC